MNTYRIVVFFSDFQYGCRSSQLTADLLTVVSHRIARAFDRVWHASFLHKLKSYGISGQIFGRLQLVLDGKSSKEHPVNAGIPQGSIFGPTLLMIFLMTLSVILLSLLMKLLSILSMVGHLICGNNLNRLLKLNLIYETLWIGSRSGLLISVLGKPNCFRLTGLITLVLLMWKWMCLFLRKNHL